MRKIIKINSNHLFKPFTVQGKNHYVECYGVFLNTNDFIPISEEKTTDTKNFEKWDFICKGKYFKDEVVLKVNFEKMTYKFGRIQYEDNFVMEE